MLVAFAAGCASQTDDLRPDSDLVVISVVGTNDVHGQFGPSPGRGGLTTFSGYLQALRAVRADDGGVLLVDGGDMWQGTLESNLNEGRLMVEAFNALGYAGAAIGNHEFDFGPEGPASVPASDSDDPRGVLKARATETRFPLLAANLIDVRTGRMVDWPNVEASTTVEVAGVTVGLIGILTRDTLLTTISDNVGGLAIAPLAGTIVREAEALRAAGATLIVVTAHAGGRCTEYGNPHDLSGCDTSSEILEVAAALPPGLVNHIVGGHEAYPIAHFVNGTAITVGRSYGRAFGRADYWVDRDSGAVRGVLLHRPEEICPFVAADATCAWEADGRTDLARPSYEGRPVTPLPKLVAIADRAAGPAAALKNQSLGVRLASPFTLRGNPESALGNLVTDILRDVSGADISIMNVSGGLRSSLPAGELTYGSLFGMFPFDNRTVVLDLSGAELRRIMAVQAHNHRRRIGISGLTVAVVCKANQLDVTMQLPGGREVQDNDRLSVSVNDFLATGGDKVLTPILPEGGLDYEARPEFVRDVIADWFRAHGGTLHPADFETAAGASRRWDVDASLPATCTL